MLYTVHITNSIAISIVDYLILFTQGFIEIYDNEGYSFKYYLSYYYKDNTKARAFNGNKAKKLPNTTFIIAIDG
jgi:hypothetical protein